MSNEQPETYAEMFSVETSDDDPYMTKDGARIYFVRTEIAMRIEGKSTLWDAEERLQAVLMPHKMAIKPGAYVEVTAVDLKKRIRRKKKDTFDPQRHVSAERVPE